MNRMFRPFRMWSKLTRSPGTDRARRETPASLASHGRFPKILAINYDSGP